MDEGIIQNVRLLSFLQVLPHIARTLSFSGHVGSCFDLVSTITIILLDISGSH